MSAPRWEAVGRAMQRARVCYCVGLDEMALAISMAPRDLRHAEHGQVRPSDELLGCYAERFRCDLGELKRVRDVPEKVATKHACKVRLKIGRVENAGVEVGCAFCGRTMSQVRFSVRSVVNHRARICDDCLLHCTDVVRHAVYEGTG